MISPQQRAVLRRYPKKRPILSAAIAEIYEEHYRRNRKGAGTATRFAQKLEAWMHRRVASDLQSLHPECTATLEIGAGNLNQLRYEPATTPYDVVEPYTELYQDGQALCHRVRYHYHDIADVPLHHAYDRITSIAAFEHLLDLPAVVARTALLIKNEGTLRVAIPSEGSLLWYLGWRLTTGVQFYAEYGLDYGELMRWEHVNNWREIQAVLQIFYGTLNRRLFGISPQSSFYQFYECTEPDRGAAKEYLQSMGIEAT